MNVTDFVEVISWLLALIQFLFGNFSEIGLP